MDIIVGLTAKKQNTKGVDLKMPIEQKKLEEKRKEVLVDFDGKAISAYPKVLIAEDAYQATIDSVNLVSVPDYDHPEQPVHKIVLQVRIGENMLPLFANPVVKKASAGGKGYSNSKLFDILEAANEIESAKKQVEALETFEGLAGFLEARLKGRACRVLVESSKSRAGDSYSTVKKIIRFEGAEVKA